MTTEKPPLDWSKPLQTTDGVKAELVYIIKRDDCYFNRIVRISGEDVLLDESGHRDFLEVQLINTPDTNLVVFSCNYYELEESSPVTYETIDGANKGKRNCRTNRIDFSMQLEPGKNYEVTGVKEVV